MSDPRRLVWFTSALIDLHRLRDFVWVKNPTAAAKASQRIRDAARKLQAHPLLGRPVQNIEAPQFRDFFIAFGKAGYILRYTVTEDAVILVKIWHSRENRNF